MWMYLGFTYDHAHMNTHTHKKKANKKNTQTHFPDLFSFLNSKKKREFPFLKTKADLTLSQNLL